MVLSSKLLRFKNFTWDGMVRLLIGLYSLLVFLLLVSPADLPSKILALSVPLLLL